MQAHANVIYLVERGNDEETNTLLAGSRFYFTGNRKPILQAINRITVRSPQQGPAIASF
jgi:hypothetical protein